MAAANASASDGPRSEELDTLKDLASSVEHRQFWNRDYLLLRVPLAGFALTDPGGVRPVPSAVDPN